MGIKNVFKWRVTTNKYLYLTDEENQAPFILDKRTGDRTYPQPISGSTVTGTTVITGMTLDEGLISQTVSNIKSADEYSGKYNKMVGLAPFDNDVSKLTFLEYDKYFNLDGDECVEEAVTPKCEGYEPVFNVSAYTLENSGETEVEYAFYAERNEADKTLRYNLELGIPRGEKGEKGDDGIGCKGDKGDDGLPAIIENVEADITAIDPDEEASVDVITRVVGDNEYELDFDFRIPRGEQGEEGPSGDEGPAGWDAVVKNVTATATALTPGSTPYAIIPTSSITINENALDKINETSFRIDFGLPTGLQGVQGNDGRNAEIREVTASVETLEPGYWYPSEDDPNRSWIRNDAEVGVDVTPGGGGNVVDLHFWFKIPRGDKGDKGDTGGGGGGSSRIFYDFDNVVVHTTTETVPYFTLHEEPTEIAGITFIRVWLEFFYPEDWGGGGGATCDDDCRKHRYDHYQNNSDSLSEGMVQVINGIVYPLATAQGVRSHAEGIGMELPPYSYVDVKIEGGCTSDYNITIPKNAIPVGVEFDDIVGLQLYLNSDDAVLSVTPEPSPGDNNNYPGIPEGVTEADFCDAIIHAEMTIVDATLVNSEDDHLQYDDVEVEYTISGVTYHSELGYLVSNNHLYYNKLKLNFVVNPPDAIGVATHTEGRACQAAGDYSHAEGWNTLTRGPHSHAEGLGTYTTNLSEHAEGQYNVSHSEDRTEFNNLNGCSTVSSIGIGDGDEDRKNAIEVMQNGDVYIYGVGNYAGTDVKCQNSEVETLQDVLNNLHTDTHRPIQVDGTEVLGNDVTPLNLSGGTNISLSDDGSGEVTIDANIPKVKHELIYYDNEKLGDDEYDGLFTQQLMLENVVVVDNQQDFDICKRAPIHPNIQDTFQQFSESPFCPEYGNGLSLTQYSHTSPIWSSGKGGYGYNSWHTSGDGSVISTDVNSEEFNGYMYPHKVRKITSESLIGAYSGGTTGDIETITLLNTNHAKARRITTTDGRTFYRDAMFDLVGSSSQTNYCAWVYKPSTTNDAYIIYSTSEQITSQEVNNGLYWTDTTQSNWNSTTKTLTKEIARNCPGNSGGSPSYNSLTNYYKDAFPTKNTDYTVYHAASIDTLADRRNTTVAGTARVDETYEAEGYLGALHILISNCRDINSMFLYGATSIIGTVMVYSEIIPISGVDNPTTECTDKQTLFSFLRNTNTSKPSYNYDGSIKNWPTYNSVDAHGMFPFKHQRRYFITVKKDDCWRVTPGKTDYTRPSTIDTSLTSGDRLVPFQSSYDMATNRSKAVAILNKFSLEDGTIRLKFSQVGASTSSSSSATLKDKFTSLNNFYLAGTESGTQTPLDYSDSELVINFKTKKYTLIDYNGNVVANNLDLVSYEDNLTTNDGDSIERTGNTKYDVTVVEHGIEKNIDICSLFTEELQFMYGTTSLNYHSLNCILLSFNDKVIYRADDNTIWKLNDAQTDYVLDPTSTAIESFTGSRFNYNDITEKLWYSNGSRIYELKADGGGGGGTGSGVTSITAGTGLAGGTITSAGTISHADTSSQSSVTNTGRSYIQSVGLDGMGHVTSLTSATETVVNTDTTYKLTLNGTQKGSGTTDLGTFYAPTGGGTSGQYLKSNGNGVPTWATFPTIPSAPGTLTTTATTSQTTATGESLSGTINLHKISKTGSYNDLLNKPTIPVNTDYQVQQSSLTTNAEYCLLAKSASGTGNTTVTSTTIFATGITINPADNSISCTSLTSNGDSYFKENIYVSGETYMVDGLYVTGDTYMVDGLEVSGSTVLNSGLEVNGGSADLTDGLNITGNTYCTGAYYASGTYSSSDIRKKDILEEISLDKAYELVNKCQTIFYTWKDDETKKKEIGLIAQEVRQYFPELVSEGRDGYLTLDYSKLTVILLTVIRDLTARVKHLETLEERIKSLEEKLK